MHHGNYAPITVYGKALKGITYRLPIASAQVKSAILLAALYAEGTTTIVEKAKTRDHTERMLHYMGVEILGEGNKISMHQQKSLPPIELKIPEISLLLLFLLLPHYWFRIVTLC